MNPNILPGRIINNPIEYGKIVKSISKLPKIFDFKNEEFSSYDKNRLLQDLADHMFTGSRLFFFFFLCETLCLIHIIAEFWFINNMLNGQFSLLGYRWVMFSAKSDPLIKIFPRLAKCTFSYFGPSGTRETRDALCFLPLNIVNEKIFTVMWFWFILLLVLALFEMLNICLVLLLPQYRYFNLRSLAPNTDYKVLRRLTSRVGYYFVLKLLAENIKPYYFKEIIEQLILDEFFDYKCIPSHEKKSLVYKTVFENVPKNKA
ncbi:innexin-like protein [Dinothrombium tinctorium]|uniref:Innexin n=1 Tax=Dinothrombium tinctorium TaxID=1965070 RepID=A0A3S3NLB9_9ACAR|nr:innexin-like protein [Dinothrombium tinctorium]